MQGKSSDSDNFIEENVEKSQFLCNSELRVMHLYSPVQLDSDKKSPQAWQMISAALHDHGLLFILHTSFHKQFTLACLV